MPRVTRELKRKLLNIKMFVMDVDGTLTDGKIIIDNDGQEYKSFNIKDGIAIKRARYKGIKTAIITGRKSNIVDIRSKELGITEVYQGVKNKSLVLDEILHKYSLSSNEVAYIGDDLNDLKIMKKVGAAFCPSDACKEVKQICDYISNYTGGNGAVREVLDMIIHVRSVYRSSKKVALYDNI